MLDFRQGEDLIDLRLFANVFGATAAARSIVFLGSDPFAAIDATQVRVAQEGAATVIQVHATLGTAPDVIAPAAPNAEIALAGLHALTAADFILAG